MRVKIKSAEEKRKTKNESFLLDVFFETAFVKMTTRKIANQRKAKTIFSVRVNLKNHINENEVKIMPRVIGMINGCLPMVD